jgi:hypothetical protein
MVSVAHARISPWNPSTESAFEPGKETQKSSEKMSSRSKAIRDPYPSGILCLLIRHDDADTGSDEELAAGLLFAEGVLGERGDLIALERPDDPRVDPELRANVLLATLSPGAFERAAKLQRGTVIGFCLRRLRQDFDRERHSQGPTPLD